MSTRRPDKSALPDPSYHRSTWKARVFLSTLADLGRVSEAARMVGMSQQSAYRRRALRPLTRKVTALPPESSTFGLGK
jgi:hypothetical protein